MILRPAEQGDIPALTKLARETFPLACPPDSDASAMDAFCREHLDDRAFSGYILNPDHYLWVGVIEGALAGYCLLIREDGASAQLSKIYVSLDYQGRGVGKALLEQVLSQAEKLRVGKLSLSVFSGNEKAKRFYRSRGFRFVGTTEFIVGSEIHLDEIHELLLR